MKLTDASNVVARLAKKITYVRDSVKELIRRIENGEIATSDIRKACECLANELKTLRDDHPKGNVSPTNCLLSDYMDIMSKVCCKLFFAGYHLRHLSLAVEEKYTKSELLKILGKSVEKLNSVVGEES